MTPYELQIMLSHHRLAKWTNFISNYFANDSIISRHHTFVINEVKEEKKYLLRPPIRSTFRSKRLFEWSCASNRQYEHLSMVSLHRTFCGMQSNRAFHFPPKQSPCVPIRPMRYQLLNDKMFTQNYYPTNLLVFGGKTKKNT